MSQQVKAEPDSATQSHIYMTINAVEADGVTRVGTPRIVDFYHGGTASWLYYKLLRKAMAMGWAVTIEPSTQEEIEEYLSAGIKALQQKHQVAA